MKKKTSTNRLTFYLWVGLGFALFWVLIDLHNSQGSFGEMLWNSLWRTCYLTPVIFVFFEFTVPFVLVKRRFLVYNIVLAIIALWVHIMAWSFGLYGWRHLGITLHIYTALVKYTTTGHELSVQMGYSVASIVFFGLIRHIYNHIKLRQSAQQLRLEKQTAELNYLRSQTNPHFLFNTLNNIYSLSRDKSDLAPESILRLSKILRFMLYETSGDYIAIEQEIKIISDYIALEKLRYDESLRINFNHTIEDMKQAMPPLLLIPLVENAFKHGVSETRGNPFVDIHLSVNKRQLKFMVKNSSDAIGGQHGVKENIGLSNLRRQLELLYRDYDLSLEQSNSTFTAQLVINLASHV